MNPPIRNLPIILKVIFMFSLLMVFMGVISYVAYLSLHGLFQVEKPELVVEGVFSGANDIRAFLFYQGITSLGSFLLAAYLFAALESGQPLQHLRFKVKPTFRLIALGIVAIIIAQFFIDFLVQLNGKIPLPSAEFDAYQKKVEAITNALMSFTGIPRFVVTVVVMAVIPAIAEECFFRGLFLGDMLKHRVHPAFAIVLSGLFFALAHFEFNNVLAIWLLGSFLGYLYYVSGSLWVPIAAHFTNNFLAVLLKYLFNTGALNADLSKATTPWYLTLISLLLFSACVYLFYRWRKTPDFYLSATEPYTNNENSTP